MSDDVANQVTCHQSKLKNFKNGKHSSEETQKISLLTLIK